MASPRGLGPLSVGGDGANIKEQSMASSLFEQPACSDPAAGAMPAGAARDRRNLLSPISLIRPRVIKRNRSDVERVARSICIHREKILRF